MKSGLQAVLRGMTGLKFVGFCNKIQQISVGIDRNIYTDCQPENLYGIMKIKSNLSDIRLVKEETAKPKKEKKTYKGEEGYSKTMSLSPELDVRGENVDTACVLIDKFLSDAIMSSLSQVRIVHGKGTGLLRQGIHRYLKTLQYVKSYRLGVFGEGDAGVTIVELK